VSPEFDAKIVGKRLRTLRSQRGMTQAELGESMGLPQTLVSDYEVGRARMHAGLVLGFAKALKVSADELLGIEKTRENGFVKDRRFLRRLQKIDRLPERQKRHLLGTIDAMLKASGIS
jgi:transcriptional regulator with XRE-family HTH domain